MKHRKLRIAWSVAWGVVAALLVALWVRSYWWIDGASMPVTLSHKVMAFSSTGRVDFRTETYGKPPGPFNPWYLTHTSVAKQREQFKMLEASGTKLKRESRYIGPSQNGFLVPHALLVFASTFATAFPWLPWRFSLRTLLIATTLVAVGLGLIVWAAK